MTDSTCFEVRQSAAEYALGILPNDERGMVAAHLLRCADCRWEVQELSAVGDQLLDLVPGTEPPLGFDRVVVDRMRADIPRPRPRSWSRWAAAAAAAVVVAGGIAGGLAASGSTGPAAPQELSAQLVQGGRPIGSVYIGGHPTWVSMTVAHLSAGVVTCELVGRDGRASAVGTFALVDGQGYWKAPDPNGLAGVVGARLVGPGGTVLASATFRP